MAYNFPDSPTVGQVFNQWTWDGEVWKLTAPNNATVAYVDAQDALDLKVAGHQTTTGGFRFNTYNIGNVTSGNVQVDAYNGNYQTYTNNGAHTWVAPANDCAVDVLLVNGPTAGNISVSGFTTGANTGDPVTSVNAQKFIISIRRMAGISTWVSKALQ